MNALKKGFKINIRCNYNLTNIDSFEELILDIDRLASDYKKQITVSLQKIWQTSYSETLRDKTERIKQLIKEKEFHCNLIGKGTISTYCYADYDNTVVVNYNGDIFKCTARDFKSELRDGVLTANGTICFTDNYKNVSIADLMPIVKTAPYFLFVQYVLKRKSNPGIYPDAR